MVRVLASANDERKKWELEAFRRLVQSAAEHIREIQPLHDRGQLGGKNLVEHDGKLVIMRLDVGYSIGRTPLLLI